MQEFVFEPPRPTMYLGNRAIGADYPVFIIAEIGTSHGGNLDQGYRLIDAAARAGADCAKFQVVFADEIIHPDTGDVPLPGGKVPLFERFRSLERDADFYAALKRHTEEAGLVFLSSAFGIRSARILRDLGVGALKIASPELNHLPLLREVSSYSLPLIVSTGVSMIADIEQATEVLGRRGLSLLHCVTAYPAPVTDYNLRVMQNLEQLFGVPVGVSDHSRDPITVPALSAALGAAVVEKHITLSNEGDGLDDPVALAPDDFRTMVGAIRRARGEGLQTTAARVGDSLGAAVVGKVLGDGVKRLAASERANYTRTN
ncbi:MAG TPA: N-acetylneuraminate synthase family protein, partial [Spirochaetia bacterium]|nr:N-acetylneuraminate synthase family protein [Spirochaetia bacterium]